METSNELKEFQMNKEYYDRCAMRYFDMYTRLVLKIDDAEKGNSGFRETNEKSEVRELNTVYSKLIENISDRLAIYWGKSPYYNMIPKADLCSNKKFINAMCEECSGCAYQYTASEFAVELMGISLQEFTESDLYFEDEMTICRNKLTYVNTSKLMSMLPQGVPVEDIFKVDNIKLFMN